jgi:hypothetical protein
MIGGEFIGELFSAARRWVLKTEVKPSEDSPKLKGLAPFAFETWNSLLLVPINISSTQCSRPCSDSRRRKSPMNNT